MLIHIFGFLVADQQQRGFEGDIILLKISWATSDKRRPPCTHLEPFCVAM